MSVFMTGKHLGKHWNNLQEAMSIVGNLSLDIKAANESKFEDRISGALQPNFASFIDQRNTKQVMTRVALFDHDHRPDMSIDTDGVAIEVKYIKSGYSFREALGQALLYRIGYRFVLVIWVDTTKMKTYRQLTTDPNTLEYKFLKELEDKNIYCIVK